MTMEDDKLTAVAGCPVVDNQEMITAGPCGVTAILK